jgi:class 3 adenylate cyclase
MVGGLVAGGPQVKPQTLIGVVAIVALALSPLLFAFDPFSMFVAGWYGVVGSLLVLRRPGNVVSWLLLVIAFGIVATTVPPGIDLPALTAGSASLDEFLPIWLSSWAGGLGFIAYTTLTMIFPSGRLPRGPWRRAAIALLAVQGVLVALSAIAPTISFNAGGSTTVVVPNRLALLPDLPLWAVWSADAAILVVIIASFASTASFVVRYRRSTGVERLQMRWLAAGVAAVVATVAFGLGSLAILGDDAWFAWLPAIVAYPLVPIAIGIAILRYRLYDVDIIINRTLVYGGATLVLAVAFGAVNVASQRMLEAVTGQRSDILTGALAVAAALAFGPVRRGIRPLVDRVLPARAVLALVFTDIVGSTRISAEFGDKRWRGLLDRYRAAVRRELSRLGGREIDTAGDGFFATFHRPVAALECAWRIRQAVRGLGLDTRTGVHVGECEMRGEKVSGLAVHTAARVMAAAPDGELVVSEALREAVGELDMQFADHGVHQLKGVPGQWHLYRVTARESATV